MHRFQLALALAALVTPAAAAADTFYLGTWKIVSAAVAPWATELAERPLTKKEMKSLVGQSITIEAKAIRGPRQLACSPVRYDVKEYPADMLFQGALAEYGDPSTAPDKIAEKVGFARRPVTSLETGCEIDFHATDADHLVFALNNSLYRMTRTHAAGK